MLGWLRKNLFQNWASTLATLVMAALGVWVVRGMVQWVLTGADWGVIVTNLQLLLIGQYPRDQVWRLWLVLLGDGGGGGAVVGRVGKVRAQGGDGAGGGDALFAGAAAVRHADTGVVGRAWGW